MSHLSRLFQTEATADEDVGGKANPKGQPRVVEVVNRQRPFGEGTSEQIEQILYLVTPDDQHVWLARQSYACIHSKRGLPANSLDFWTGFFEYVKTVPYLMGDNRDGWLADFDFLIRESKFTRIFEGGYRKIEK